MTILFFYSALPAGSEPLLGGMSPWLVWADLPEIINVWKSLLYSDDFFFKTLLRIYWTCEIEQRRIGPGWSLSRWSWVWGCELFVEYLNLWFEFYLGSKAPARKLGRGSSAWKRNPRLPVWPSWRFWGRRRAPPTPGWKRFSSICPDPSSRSQGWPWCRLRRPSGPARTGWAWCQIGSPHQNTPCSGPTQPGEWPVCYLCTEINLF